MRSQHAPAPHYPICYARLLIQCEHLRSVSCSRHGAAAALVHRWLLESLVLNIFMNEPPVPVYRLPSYETRKTKPVNYSEAAPVPTPSPTVLSL